MTFCRRFSLSGSLVSSAIGVSGVTDVFVVGSLVSSAIGLSVVTDAFVVSKKTNV